MCLYPKLILNKKYQPNKKNKYKPPICEDERLRYVTAACGKCMECRKQKARAWQVRLYEEQKEKKNGIFVTLTFNEESHTKLKNETNNEENELATRAVRLFLERVRKETKKSIRHWLTTEKGHTGTKRIHLHGIIWDDNATELVKKYWKYGFIYIGEYVNEKTINYVVKYITKTDFDNKGFESKVLCSAGIGKNYINGENAKNNKYKGKETKAIYRTQNGTILNLPIYYKNKLYTEEEKEQMWKDRLDEGKVWICGEETDINDYETYNNLLQFYQRREKELNGENEKKWEREKYIRQLKRQQKYKKKYGLQGRQHEETKDQQRSTANRCR